MTRLRTSSHRLAIESGRWSRPNRTPLENRLCIVCMILEDEYHFVLECPLYADLRKTYIRRYFWNRPSMFKFIELVTSENNIVCRRLAMFVHKAFAVRNLLLFHAV